MNTDRILDALLVGLSVAAGATAVYIVWTTRPEACVWTPQLGS